MHIKKIYKISTYSWQNAMLCCVVLCYVITVIVKRAKLMTIDWKDFDFHLSRAWARATSRRTDTGSSLQCNFSLNITACDLLDCLYVKNRRQLQSNRISFLQTIFFGCPPLRPFFLIPPPPSQTHQAPLPHKKWTVPKDGFNLKFSANSMKQWHSIILDDNPLLWEKQDKKLTYE